MSFVTNAISNVKQSVGFSPYQGTCLGTRDALGFSGGAKNSKRRHSKRTTILDSSNAFEILLLWKRDTSEVPVFSHRDETSEDSQDSLLYYAELLASRCGSRALQMTKSTKPKDEISEWLSQSQLVPENSLHNIGSSRVEEYVTQSMFLDGFGGSRNTLSEYCLSGRPIKHEAATKALRSVPPMVVEERVRYLCLRLCENKWNKNYESNQYKHKKIISNALARKMIKLLVLISDEAIERTGKAREKKELIGGSGSPGLIEFGAVDPLSFLPHFVRNHHFISGDVTDDLPPQNCGESGAEKERTRFFFGCIAHQKGFRGSGCDGSLLTLINTKPSTQQESSEYHPSYFDREKGAGHSILHSSLKRDSYPDKRKKANHPTQSMENTVITTGSVSDLNLLAWDFSIQEKNWISSSGNKFIIPDAPTRLLTNESFSVFDDAMSSELVEMDDIPPMSERELVTCCLFAMCGCPSAVFGLLSTGVSGTNCDGKMLSIKGERGRLPPCRMIGSDGHGMLSLLNAVAEAGTNYLHLQQFSKLATYAGRHHRPERICDCEERDHLKLTAAATLACKWLDVYNAKITSMHTESAPGHTPKDKEPSSSHISLLQMFNESRIYREELSLLSTLCRQLHQSIEDGRGASIHFLDFLFRRCQLAEALTKSSSIPTLRCDWMHAEVLRYNHRDIITDFFVQTLRPTLKRISRWIIYGDGDIMEYPGVYSGTSFIQTSLSHVMVRIGFLFNSSSDMNSVTYREVGLLRESLPTFLLPYASLIYRAGLLLNLLRLSDASLHRKCCRPDGRMERHSIISIDVKLSLLDIRAMEDVFRRLSCDQEAVMNEMVKYYFGELLDNILTNWRQQKKANATTMLSIASSLQEKYSDREKICAEDNEPETETKVRERQYPNDYQSSQNFGAGTDSQMIGGGVGKTSLTPRLTDEPFSTRDYLESPFAADHRMDGAGNYGISVWKCIKRVDASSPRFVGEKMQRGLRTELIPCETNDDLEQEGRSETVEIEVALQRCVTKPIVQQCMMVEQLVVSYILYKSRFIFYLALLRRFSLGLGSYLQGFSFRLFELYTKKQWTAPTITHVVAIHRSCLSDSGFTENDSLLSWFNYCSSNNEDDTTFPLSLMQSQRRDNSFMVRSAIPPPVSSIIDAICMKHYNRLQKFLLRHLLVEHMAKEVWKVTCRTNEVEMMLERKTKHPLLFRFYLFRYELQHVVSLLSMYLNLKLQASWRKMECELQCHAGASKNRGTMKSKIKKTNQLYHVHISDLDSNVRATFQGSDSACCKIRGCLDVVYSCVRRVFDSLCGVYSGKDVESSSNRSRSHVCLSYISTGVFISDLNLFHSSFRDLEMCLDAFSKIQCANDGSNSSPCQELLVILRGGR